MERADASDLLAFLAVARERNFTRAAARLAISQPTLSQTVQALEERLGVRLLNRTTQASRRPKRVNGCCRRSAPSSTRSMSNWEP